MEERPEDLLQRRCRWDSKGVNCDMGTEPGASETMTQGAWEVADRRTGGEGKVR